MKRNNSKLIFVRIVHLFRFSHSIHYRAPEQSFVGTRMQCSCSALNFHLASGILPHDNIFDAPEKDSCENHGKIRQCIFFTNNIFISFMTEILSNLKYCNLVLVKQSSPSIGMQWQFFSKFQVIEVTNDIPLILFCVNYVRLYANTEI